MRVLATRYLGSVRTLTLLLLVFCLFGFSKKENHPEHFVFDHEDAFSQEEEIRLDTLFRGHELRTTNEIVLITTKDYHGAMDMRTFAATCGDSLGVGKKRKNNGVVITFSKRLREVFIATGLGTERVLNDWYCQNIIDSIMLPNFKKDRYFEGLFEGGSAMIKQLEKPENIIH